MILRSSFSLVFTFLAPAVAVLCMASTLSAQQTPNAAPGFRADAVYDLSELDDVALFNGALSLSIPLGIRFPSGGAFSHRLGLDYSSTIWDSRVYSSPCPTPSTCPVEFRPKSTHDAGLGWRLSLPELIPPGDWNQTTSWIYVGADGSEHTFYDTLHASDSDDPGDTGATQTVRYSRDGSYLRLTQSPGSSAARVEMGQEVHTFTEVAGVWQLTRMEDRFGNGLDVTRAVENGDVVWQLDDGYRSQKITYVDQGASFPHQRFLISEIELAAFGNTTATYTFHYATKTVFRPAAHNHPDPTDRSISVRLLQRIELPDTGGTYRMGAAASPTYSDQGLLEQLRLPTLGYLEWDWEPYAFPAFRTLPPNQEDDEAVDPYNSVFGVSKRRQKTISGAITGEWTYSRDFEPGLDVIGELPEKLTVTVERPLGDRSEHFFSVYPAKDLSGQPAPQWGTGWNEYALPYTRSESDSLGGDRYLSSKIFDCDENGNGCELVRSEYVSYELDDDAFQNDATGALFNKNRRVSSRRTLDHYTVNSSQQTDHRLEVYDDFDGLGNYRRVTYSSNFGPTRTIVKSYNPDRGTYPGSFQQMPTTAAWLTGLYDFQEITESGTTARQEFCFGESTGFLQRRRVLKRSDGVRSANDLIERFTIDDRGHPTAQLWYGGDLVPVGTGELCALNLGTSSFRLTNTYRFGALETSRYTYHDGTFDSSSSGGPLTFYEVDRDIDPNTGLVATSRDRSGLSTSYTYDALGRLRTVQPEASSGAAYQKIWFGLPSSASQPARAEVRELPNGSLNNNDALTETRYRWDGLGRLDRTSRRLPESAGGGLSHQNRAYDAEGREWSVSTWDDGWETGHASRDFDPFDRPRILEPPDADTNRPEHRIHLAYEGFRKTTTTQKIGTTINDDGAVVESDVSRAEEFDAYERLVAVTEPSGPSGSVVRTTYAYDLADRLTRVEMPVGSGTQVRSWSYDQRGFLASECHPEKNGSCVSYSDYNPLAGAGEVVDGPFTHRYTYDRGGGRVTTIRDGSSRLLKAFAYGRSSTSSNRANGKLVRAANYQYPELGQGIREQRFVEDFRYGGIGGARDERDVTWFRECEPGEATLDCLDDGFCEEESFSHREAFDPTGKLVEIQYPECASADGGCGPTHPRTVSYDFDPGSGFLTSIPGWVDSLSYHRNQTLSRVEHSNGLVDRIAEDPDHMGRPAALWTESDSSNVLWQSGSLRFDGAGNLLEMSGDGIFGEDVTDRFVYDGVSRLTQSRQWIRGSPQPTIFADGFESGDTSAWIDDLPDPDYPINEYSEQSFGYDIPGNQISVTTDGETESTSISSVTNRLNGASYNGAGHLTQMTDETGAEVSFEYDALGRLTRRQRGNHFTLYFYTADDERILRFGTDGFQWTLRDLQGRVLREAKPEADRIQPIRDHIYRGGSLLATVAAEPSGELTQVYHQHLDHLGSPRIISDEAGNVVSEHKYYPFGAEATNPAQNDLPLKFTGHERDFYASGEADDLDYMHARYCDPRLGRFLTPDPVRGSPSRPQSWNRYAYVYNNPMAYVDPDGRLPWGLIKKVAKLIWKGGDAAATFGGIVEDAATVANPHAPPTARAGAAVSLVSEVVSPLTAREARAGVEAINSRVTAGRRARVGKPVPPLAKTLDHALNPDSYVDAVVKKYGINLRGSGQDIRVVINPDLSSLGLSRRATPNVIEINPSLLSNEAELANTIAHELNHARSWLKGGSAPEIPAYAAGNALESYIRGER